MSYNIVQEDGTLKKVAGLSKLNVWTGTQADYNAQKNTIPNGSYVNITDDAESGNGIKDIYSTDEVKTNKVWIDGKPIYRKVIENVAWTSNEWNANILSKINVSTMDNWIYICGIAPNQRCVSIIQFDKSSGLWVNASTVTNGTLIMEYTKN